MIDINELRRRAEWGYKVASDIVIELLDRLEAAEKERDDFAQLLVQSEIGKREISEARGALQVEVGKLKVLEVSRCVKINEYIVDNARLAEEVERLRAKIAEMEKQEPVAWMLNCPTLGGDTGWILSWTQSGAGLCNRLQGEENEKMLYALPCAQPESSVPDGWKLVPIEPTTEMICEMERQWMCGSQIDMAKREWKAACAAAPEAKP